MSSTNQHAGKLSVRKCELSESMSKKKYVICGIVTAIIVIAIVVIVVSILEVLFCFGLCFRMI